MQCPSCGQHTPDDWSPLIVRQEFRGARVTHLEAPQADAKYVHLDWMHCANEECRELVIRVHESFASGTTYHAEGRTTPTLYETATWYARPRTTQRRLDPLVLEPFRSAYQEASAILDLSPRMSAVLSRKVVFDLLEEYAGISEYTLKGSLDKFIADTSRPQRVRENLQHLREIGDFGAHTKKDSLGAVIEVTREDAEWTLDLLDRLFDYFIVEPERDRKLQAKWDKNIADAGRKPIQPLPDVEPEEADE